MGPRWAAASHHDRQRGRVHGDETDRWQEARRIWGAGN